MSPRGIYERAPRARLIPKSCDVVGCDRVARSSGGAFCEMHYYRMRRTGTTALLPREVPSSRIRRDQTIRDMYESGLSTTAIGKSIGMDSSSIAKILRGLGVKMREFGGSGDRSGQWVGDHPTYSGAHMRVRSVRGNASHQTCHCGRPARQWAYKHDDPNELSAPQGQYSANPDHYEAMCVPCHKRFDLNRIGRAS